jgi:acetyl esterase/lipase
MGGVAWALFAVSIAFGAVVVNAYRPMRREPLTVASFVLGWVPSELPLHVLAVEIAVVAVLAVKGGLASWPGWVGLVACAGSVAGLGGLAVVAHRSGDLVRDALDQATRRGPDLVDFEPAPSWYRGWRLVIAVPFRFRAIRRIRNIDYWGDGKRRHKLDVIVRRSGVREPAAPVLVYIHGGAWVMGEKRQQGIPMMHELVSRGWVCVAINYGLSPKVTWPTHIVDCKRAVAWVREHIDEYGGDPGFIAVAGGSAGGHLSSLLALTPNVPEWQPGFEELDTSVDACVPSYGVFDMTVAPDLSGAYGPGLLEMLESKVMKVTQQEDPTLFEAASPDHRVTGSAPPMFVLHGANDTLVPPSVARHFVAELRARSQSTVCSVELPCAQHAFDVFASIRCRHTTMGIVRFLEGVRAAGIGYRDGATAGPVSTVKSSSGA